MASKRTLMHSALFASSLMILLAGCETSVNTGVAPGSVSLPDLPLDLVGPCEDAAVTSNALESLVDHRRSLAACREKHRQTVLFYRDAKRNLEGPR